MSLTRLGVRIAAVQAIKSATLAEDRVYDSAVGSIDELTKAGAKPFLIVTTDDDETNLTGRDLLGGNGSLDVVIEYALAGVTDTGTFVVPHTDEGMEIVLDLMHRQITRALITEETVWSTSFKRLVPSMHRLVSRRGASATEGVRFAARQIVLTVSTINDPDYGKALDADHPLKVLADNLTAAGGDLAPIADMINAEAAGTLIPDWDRVMTDLGITKTAATAVRIGDYIETEDAVPVVEVEAENTDTATTYVVNEANADEQDPPDA